MELAFFVTAFATLFVVIDPIGLMPMFVALTQGADPAHRRRIARHASLTAAGILLAFTIFGEALLGFIGISMSAFRIAGGILLLLTALDMLFDRRAKRRESQIEDLPDPSVFPLATPLIAGPGAIASMILLMGQTQATLDAVLLVGVLLSVLLLVYLSFLSGNTVERLLGHTGINVITRLLGMLLAALSIQFMLDGIFALDWASLTR